MPTAPRIVVSATQLDFGSVDVGDDAVRSKPSDFFSHAVETDRLEILFGRDSETVEERIVESPVAYPRCETDVPDGRGEVRVGFDVLQSRFQSPGPDGRIGESGIGFEARSKRGYQGGVDLELQLGACILGEWDVGLGRGCGKRSLQALPKRLHPEGV